MKRAALFFVFALFAVSSLAAHAFAEDAGKPGAGEKKYEKATFAGGCFWCIEPPFDKMDGVIDTIAGYTGGTVKNPTYREVSTGTTGHAEAVEIIFDPEVVSYDELLDVYWLNIDPTDAGGQFADRGSQYRPEIFYHSEAQRKAAEASKKKLGESGKFSDPVVVGITEAAEFYPAEEYHQSYYKKNELKYKMYKYGSGRQSFIDKHGGEGSSD
ncbi:MAG: peptide-methionine (S)-S-oxide reductase MsrA [Candidatus Dadabacteria bacterium]|nr:peptide-methionine (S)-S-oxide reductase MsrA [Candidatus Dadabacteria bacterium]